MSIIIELRPTAGPALIVGGGAVALRKALTLAEGAFRVTVIASEVSERLSEQPFVTVIERPFEDRDMDAVPPWALVFACTNDRAVNHRIGELARLRNVLVVVTDAQDESTFFTPSTIRDGDLAIAVSTGGASPSLAKAIRERIVTALGPGWGTVTSLARQERQRRLAEKREERR